ncbi:hypothetical protein RMATCC62417_14506 [Rhizopus microsporus]|nr:hypothetical protein RMATCC62417_14506 [Rhizopus microsporus]
MRDYLDKSAPKENGDMWNQFIEKNFDNMATEAMTMMSNEPAEERQPQIETHLHIEYRTCSLSMKKVIRSDLSPNLKNIIHQKLRDAMSKASDYAASISEVVYMMMVTFKSHCFTIENNEIVFGQTECFKIAEILPKDFTDDNVDVLTSTPALPLTLMNSPFADEIANLFEEDHLSLIHSYFFGALDLIKQT